MVKIYTEFKEIRKIALKIKKKYKDLLSEELLVKRIYFMKVEGWHGRALATCMKVMEPYHTIIDRKYDFIIQYAINKIDEVTEKMGKKQRWNYIKVITLHEMMHIGDEGKIRRHDIEDFRILLKKFGIEWVSGKDLPDILGE